MNDDEVWKTYPEFDFIQGSNLGRVRTLDHYVNGRWGKTLIKGRVLKKHRNRGGYMRVNFRVDGKFVNRSVHRIIASCFLENPDNLPQVNHKDCDPTNNRVENLEWCDSSYNMQYREKYGVSNTETLGHRIIAINLKTLEVHWFQSQGEAARQLGANQPNIKNVIKGKRYKSTHGYWFTNADSNAVEYVRTKFGNSVAREVEELLNKEE